MKKLSLSLLAGLPPPARIYGLVLAFVLLVVVASSVVKSCQRLQNEREARSLETKNLNLREKENTYRQRKEARTLQLKAAANSTNIKRQNYENALHTIDSLQRMPDRPRPRELPR